MTREALIKELLKLSPAELKHVRLDVIYRTVAPLVAVDLFIGLYAAGVCRTG
ncbi:hypothetical protein E308F_20860 [Moorella sp. E308F]|jgi:hypothetical protein|uniref:hypothetical protein n=1 Tax=unclassified Neomoorella TaxID=2676739 RepID=UPI0010FFC278|nr:MULTISPECIES: hypothetical protein [unclassified Moorella (in: firmicutes)]GEA15842.1 hypothetical protein E308F_20860 [Moorella sp. E308F]GEA19331.1 hypothetical protein E306M_24690 [Moorella sp. E306M]